MRPTGVGGSRKVKRIMQDRKIPQSLRDEWPLVVMGGEIVWIVGEVVGESADLAAADCVRLTLSRTTG